MFGGTGSIGSLLVSELLKLKPSSIRVLCQYENELHKAEQKWKEYTNIRYLLGDIRDSERVIRALKNADYAFNCAAVKHVKYAEGNPLEAVTINILGLENIINACVIQGIEVLLHMSTDKAVESTTVMGSSKFIGERLCQIRAEQNAELRIIVVRSGNVEFSSGSFTELLKTAKEEDKPINLTHPEMKRFFIKGDEIAKFILQAFELGKSGEIWIPKLEEIKIIDLIGEYPYKIIGIQKGEKLEEKLVSDEEMRNIKDFDNRWVISGENTVS